MPHLIFLGTAAALPTAHQDNTSLLLENNGHYVMVDCSGMPYRKLLHLGVPLDALDHVVITHAHVDHMYGLPSLIDSQGIAGRTTTLHIYALGVAMEVIVPLLDLWSLRTRDYCNFPIELHYIEGKEDEAVFSDNAFTLRTTPTRHALPSVAVKFTFPNRPTTLVYSSDTAPCDTLVRFAKGTDYFLLENTYCNDNVELSKITGHMYPQQFRRLANQVAATKKTILVHHSDAPECPTQDILTQIEAASELPDLEVTIPQDLDIIELL
jgi:ribonuclease Z